MENSNPLPRRAPAENFDDIIIDDEQPGIAAGVRRYQPPEGSYQGAELGRTCQRPGAYAAYDLPSVFGTRRVFPGGAA